MTETAEPRAFPVELRAPKGARVMEIVWDDGVTTTHRHLHLRAFCPCAQCQGHQGPIEWNKAADGFPDAALELSSIDEVGTYAIQLGWADGHRTGIYSFRYLRELARLTELAPSEVRRQRFGR